MIAALRRMYRGETHVDFIGRRRIGYRFSLVLIIVTFVSLGVRGLDFSIEFEGGVVWQVPVEDVTVAEARDALRPLGLGDAIVQLQRPLGGGDQTLRVQAGPESSDAEGEVAATLAELAGVDEDDVNVNEVGPSWGDEISSKAQRALVFFFLAIALYITLRFEWKMAAAALVAVVHDIVIAVGIYSLFGFSVSPATVIAFLTILGYSLYDTVVVFDKVNENAVALSTARSGTYSGMVNRSLNEVLMRSINTTTTSLLPVLSILVVGGVLLGAVVLRDFSLALFIGLAVGAYSSIFIAAPLLAQLKEREPRFAAMRTRMEGRQGPLVPSGGRPTGRSAVSAPAVDPGPPPAADVPAADVPAADVSAAEAASAEEPAPPSPRPAPPPRSRPSAPGTIQPRGRKKGRRR